MLKVQIKSKETIKPSSPTPLNHPPLQLSSLDHTSPQIYTHILLFYSTTITINVPHHLKTSLSTTLLHFSALAGRIQRSNSDGTLYVHYTDDGAVFVEAEAEANLHSFLTTTPINDFSKLLPIKKDHFNLSDPLLAVQLTMFDSGGHALGLSMSHLLADGASIAMFLKEWSTISRGQPIGSLPNFDFASSLFPPPPPPPPQPWSTSTVEKPDTANNYEVAIKRFVIDKDGVERLREGKEGWRPTRVEAVSGLVWRCLRRAKGLLFSGEVSHVVNIRKKVAPLIVSDEECFGNLWVSVLVNSDEYDQRFEEAMREGVRSVNEEYVKKLIEEKKEEKEKSSSACWIFTSWCRMGFYEKSDFGWGEAVWVGCGLREMKDVCMLIDAKDGDGVEVWVWLDGDDMDKLHTDLEFLSFVSF